jgi:hypothetical protein
MIIFPKNVMRRFGRGSHDERLLGEHWTCCSLFVEEDLRLEETADCEKQEIIRS